MAEQTVVRVGEMAIGNELPLVVIAGPCVIEGEDFTLRVAERLAEMCRAIRMPLIFKSSFDKANRTSIDAYRGPGLEEGLRILARVRSEVGVPVITDVHLPEQAAPVAEVVDVLQTPAFLCRQTDFILEVARQGKPVNIKKGQFLAPWDMQKVLEKARSVGNDQIILCERGVCFGYNNLVADMRSLVIMRRFGAPVVFDATHSVQQPGGLGGASGGDRRMAPYLAQAAVAVGVAAVFMETHPDPDRAKSDGPNSIPLAQMPALLDRLRRFDEIAKQNMDQWQEDER